MYIARFKNNRTQSVHEHITNVSKYCFDFGEIIKLQYTAKLCGILHDIGKYSDSFQKYIKQAQLQTQNGTYEQWIKTVKKVDHGVYGAKYIYDIYGNDKTYNKFVCDIISEVICYHHGGLPNNINENNQIPFLNRINSVTKEDMQKIKQMQTNIKQVDDDDVDITELIL